MFVLNCAGLAERQSGNEYIYICIYIYISSRKTKDQKFAFTLESINRARRSHQWSIETCADREYSKLEKHSQRKIRPWMFYVTTMQSPVAVSHLSVGRWSTRPEKASGGLAESTHRRPEPYRHTPSITAQITENPWHINPSCIKSLFAPATVFSTIEILWASKRPSIEVHTESIVTNCIKVSIVPGTDAKLTFKMSSVSGWSCKSLSFFINSSVGVAALAHCRTPHTVYPCLPRVWSMDKETGQMAKISIENHPILGRGSTPRQAKIYSVKRIKASVENMALCEVRSPYTSRQTVPYRKMGNRDQRSEANLPVWFLSLTKQCVFRSAPATMRLLPTCNHLEILPYAKTLKYFSIRRALISRSKRMALMTKTDSRRPKSPPPPLTLGDAVVSTGKQPWRKDSRQVSLLNPEQNWISTLHNATQQPRIEIAKPVITPTTTRTKSSRNHPSAKHCLQPLPIKRMPISMQYTTMKAVSRGCIHGSSISCKPSSISAPTRREFTKIRMPIT